MPMAVRLALVASLAAALAGPAGPAVAQHGGSAGGHPASHGAWHAPGHGFAPRHGGIGFVRPPPPAHWRSGRWVHAWHNGRFGWWWALGGVWYFYPAPIYPYPVYAPPAAVMPTPPQLQDPLTASQYWYFCDNPAGYYPYVVYCNGAWHAVPATPAGP